uniref:RNA1 polyprotein n=2 Tax=Secoviridae TaxID=675072 RepID=A0A343J2H2_9SECO|nr:polyprotein [Dioscorea mosaic associated virus]
MTCIQPPIFNNIHDHIRYVGNFHLVRKSLLKEPDEARPCELVLQSVRNNGNLNSVLELPTESVSTLLDDKKWFKESEAQKIVADVIHPETARVKSEEELQGLFSNIATGFLISAGQRTFGYVADKCLTRYSSVAGLLEKLNKVVDKILDGFDWLSGLIDNVSSIFTAIKNRVMEYISQALEKIQNLLNHFSYLVPLVCGILIASNVFFLVNKVLQIFAPSAALNSFRVTELLAVVGAVIGVKELTSYLLSLTKNDKRYFVNTIRNFLGVDAEVAGLVAAESSAVPMTGAQIRDERERDLISFGTFEPMMLQAGIFDVGIFGAVISMISLFMDAENKSWLQKLSYSSSVVKNVSDGYEKCSKIVAQVSDWLYTKLGTSSTHYAGAAQALLIHSGVGIHDWLEECEQLLTVGNTSLLTIEEMLTQCRKLIDQSTKITQFLMRSEEGSTFILRHKFLAVDKQLREFYNKIVQSNMTNIFRETPFVVVLHGQPGVGKSTLMRVLGNDLLDQLEEPQKDRFYSRNSGDAYWSGYIRQPMVLFDDFAQIQQTNGMFDEASLIPLVSCNPYLLPMAALEEKGRPFDSKYMILCTNRKRVDERCELADREAFYRRRHLFWDVTRNPDVPYDPNCCHANLRFTLRNSLDADLATDDTAINIGYYEMLAYTANKAEEHRNKEKAALRSLAATRNSQSRVVRENGTFRVADELQADNFMLAAATSIFSLDKFLSQGGDMPNFRRMVNAVDGQLDLFCLGSKAFFDMNGNSLQETQWTVTELQISEAIETGKNLVDLQGALCLFLLLSDSNYAHHKEFMHMVDERYFLEHGEIKCPGKDETVERVANEYWCSVSDAVRYITKEIWKKRSESEIFAVVQELKNILNKMSCVQLWNSMPFWLKWAVGTMALFAGGAVLFKGIRLISSILLVKPAQYLACLLGISSISDNELQGVSSGGNELVGRATRRVVRGFQLQGGAAEDIPHVGAWAKCERARIMIDGVLIPELSATGMFGRIYGVMVGNRRILISSHMVKMINWSLPCTISNDRDVSARFYLRPEQVTHQTTVESARVKYGNLAIINYSSGIPAFPHFSGIDYDRAISGPTSFKGYIMDNLKGLVDYPIVTVFERKSVKDEIELPNTNLSWRKDRILQCNEPGEQGMCGRLALVEKNGTLLIVGMHNFGNARNCAFSDIPLEFKPSDDLQSEFSMTETPIKQITEMVTQVGFLDTPVPQLRTSQIEKSPIFEDLEDLNGPAQTEPTILSVADPRPPIPFDPYEQGIRKFEKQAGPFDFSEDSDLDLAQKNISSEWERLRPERFEVDTVTTLEVAIQGIDGLDYAESLPIATSEGFPYILERRAGDTGKERYFEEINGKRIPKGNWEPDIEEIEKAATAGNLEIYTMACAKDEKTSKKKIYETPKTRIFEILPFTFNLVIRKYFLFWMQWMMKNHLNLPCKVGLNVFGFGWDEMKFKHGAYSHHFCGDYSGFDSNTNVAMLDMIADMISDFARDGARNRLIRRNLMHAAVTRRMIVGRNIYKIVGGTPSGFALTVMVNSIVNELYLKMAWFNLSKRHFPEISRDADLNHNVHISTYGDDNVVSFSAQVSPWYNLVTVSEYLKAFGVRLTDGKKTGNIIPHMPFCDIDFLKRKWVLDDHRSWYRCPLDKISIEGQCYWIKKSESCYEALKVNIENSLREAYQWGEEYFTHWRGRLSTALNRRRMYDVYLPTLNDAARFWNDQRENASLPIHFEDPSARIKYIASSKEGHYDNVHCLTARSINKLNQRNLVNKIDTVWISAGERQIRHKKTFEGANHVYVPTLTKPEQLAKICKEIYKDKCNTCEQEFCTLGTDPRNEIVIATDQDQPLSHAIGMALVLKYHRDFGKKQVWLSGLDDKAYKAFVNIMNYM